MRPSIPQLMRRSAALLFLLVVPVFLSAPSATWAQYVTSVGSLTGVTLTGVQCGEEVISFDTLNLPTEGANEAREKELTKLYAFAGEAWEACNGLPTTFPGCRFLNDWVEARNNTSSIWKKSDEANYAKRTRLRALDAQVIPQSMRVLAHKKCESTKAILPRECVALIEAESAAVSMKVCPKDLEEKQKALTEKIESTGISLKGKKAASIVEKCQKGECKSDEEQRQFRAVIGAEASLFYNKFNRNTCSDSANAAKNINEDIERKVLDIKLNPPTLTPFPAASPGGHREKAYQALKDEHGELEKRMKGECKSSTYYVTPTGILIENDELIKNNKDLSNPQKDKRAVQSATLCIDTSTFAIDRPYDVTISAYPEGVKYPGGELASIPSRIPTRSLRVWAGERTELKLDTLFKDYEDGKAVPSIMKITIRGYPRGVSLRALAQRGSSPLDGSYEAVDLLAQARKVAEAKEPLEFQTAEADELAKLAALLGAEIVKKDTVLEQSFRAMAENVDKAKADEKNANNVSTANTSVISAIEALQSFLTKQSNNSEKVLTKTAVERARKKIPSKPDGKLETIKKAQAEINGYKSTLEDLAAKQREANKSAADLKDALDKKLARLCRISKELIPVVDEDVLLARTTEKDVTPGVFVIDYDYEAGFQRAPNRQLQRTDRVYLRVRRVRPNEAVAVAIEDKGVVQHSVSLVGYIPTGNPPAADSVALTGGPRSGMNDIQPDQLVVQAGSTQILALPSLDGPKKYNISLCGISDKTGVCTSDTSKSRIIAANTLVVHTQRYLGVRAGVGIMSPFGKVRTLSDVPGSSLKYVRGNDVTFDASVPLLLTYYPKGRDAVDLPKGVSGGIGAGLDMAALFQVKPRLYVGGVVDIWGLGITFGLLVEQRATINAAEGTYVPNPANATALESKRWYGGGFLAVTTDFYIFEAVLRNYILGSPNPTIGNTGGK